MIEPNAFLTTREWFEEQGMELHEATEYPGSETPGTWYGHINMLYHFVLGQWTLHPTGIVQEREIYLRLDTLPLFLSTVKGECYKEGINTAAALRTMGARWTCLSVPFWEDSVLDQYNHLIPEIREDWEDEDTGELVLVDSAEDWRGNFARDYGAAFDDEFLAEYGI